MKKFNLSLSWKILGLLSIFFLIASLVIANSWISKNNQDFKALQQQRWQQDLRQFEIIQNLLRNRIETWFESYIPLAQNQLPTVEQTSIMLTRQIDFIQLHWQINNIWLFREPQDMAYSSSDTSPPLLNDLVTKTFHRQMATDEVACGKYCEHYYAMPILVEENKIAVIVVTTMLQEALASLHQATNAELALVKQTSDPSHRIRLEIQPPISSTQRNYIEKVLSMLPDNSSDSVAEQQGIALNFKQHSLLINLIPLNTASDQVFYAMLVHNMTQTNAQHRQFQQLVQQIAIATVVLSLITFFILTQRLRRRLQSVSNSLPLLAARQYNDFRQHQYIQSSLFIDEIDQLQNSANQLAQELESLDNQIALNTRELENIAMFDKLCGLPNRNMLNQFLKQSLAELKRNDMQLAVMFLDFDNFRHVNDSHGHNIGDTFLIEAANKIKQCVRETDFVGRFGGDEFVVVLQHANVQKALEFVSNKLLSCFREPLVVSGQRFYITASIGVVITNNAQEQVDTIIRQADMAMYAAKDQGGDRFCLFEPQMYQNVVGRVEIENEMREAFNNDELFFALQPQIEISTGKLVGFEALVRWIHPVKGFIPPDKFIPVLENSENMVQLGYWGLKRAFSILNQLEKLGYPNQRIAVNLSAIQLLDPGLVPFLREQIRDSGKDGSQIELEITERTLVADIDHTLDIMKTLRSMGFSFSIDDFGTGYSSLAYLKQMPVDIIKIDRSFIAGMTTNRADMQIVSSTIAMVQQLGMKVVAEGVETTAQMRMLADMNCEIAQGYLISKPLLEQDLYQQIDHKLQNGLWEEARLIREESIN
ncbi:bifunctional diguanylate cyclase/phosphodiesterase [Neptunicella marina]|uniref:EAL domain-containing protein n=1 Tax=Neptunicella marina TaxID=2125989 RepID=A0A8J6LZ66_9ALTE|nr:bifunctional diguanylate cyclase/phosphodiesterase [Neptunicella marina]MBC3765905.1 EAL domain-containing protein [Neptunicella marina]